MNRLQRILYRALPDMGQRLPICGLFFTGRQWNGVGPLPYPGWFIRCCRVEVWVITQLYRLTGKGIK